MGNIIESQIYQPPLRESPLLKDLSFFKNKYGIQLYGLFINRQQKQTLLISHGNTENLYMTLNWVEEYLLKEIKNCNVFIYEYSGYTQKNYVDSKNVDEKGRKINKRMYLDYDYIGKMGGKLQDLEKQKQIDKKLNRLQELVVDSTEEEQLLKKDRGDNVKPQELFFYADIEAAYSYLITNHNLNPYSLVLLGQSLGSGPSIYLASKYKIGGLILISAFTSIYRILFNFRFDMYGDKFNNLETLKLISRPVLLIHGTMDEIVPFEHSIELYSVLRNKYPPFWIEGYEHNNILQAGKQLWQHIDKFLENLDANSV